MPRLLRLKRLMTSYIVINESNCIDAWKAASDYLLNNNKSCFNLLIGIDSPTECEDKWIECYNPKLFNISSTRKGDDLRDVIHTIFPVKHYRNIKNRTELYSKYLKTHLRSSKISGKKYDRWGTYFTRLIWFDTIDQIKLHINSSDSLEQIGKIVNSYPGRLNQLESVISALTNWKSNEKAALYCHISSPMLDTLQPLGLPCLQFIQFTKANDGSIDLTAVYRNHDYFNKALGNFIGLGQLLEFVCNESNKTAGKLNCHSIRAYFRTSKTVLRELLNNE